MSEEGDNVLVPSSVVIVPETTSVDDDNVANITLTSLKRRKSSDASYQNKRRRLSNDDDVQAVEDGAEQSPKDDISKSHDSRPTAVDDSKDVENPANTNRRASGAENTKDEERKRGRRLFGSLLGTLSQSSSSSSTMMLKQKRRADIDRKQQEKLKLQTEEYNEERKRRLDELTERRKEEQVLWDEESTRIRHQNLLATANFLSTKTLPKLYYRPWELKPEEESTIQNQIDQAKGQVARESQDTQPMEQSPRVEPLEASSRNGEPRNVSGLPAEQNPDDREINDREEEEDGRDVSVNETNTDNTNKAQESPAGDHNDNELVKDAGDENEEMMVEAGEDAVIW